jgi:hypothetical protein
MNQSVYQKSYWRVHHCENSVGSFITFMLRNFLEDISDTLCLTTGPSDMSAPQVEGVSAPDQQPVSGKRPARLRQILTVIAGAAIVVCAYWNLVTTYNLTSQTGPRETDLMVTREQRLAAIRQHLIYIGYKGEIGFITDTDLVPGRPWKERDGMLFGETQDVMLPWMLLHGRRDTPFVIANFPDGVPAVPLEGYSTTFDVGDGYILLRRIP